MKLKDTVCMILKVRKYFRLEMLYSMIKNVRKFRRKKIPDDPLDQMHFNIDSDVRDSSSSEECDNTQRRSSAA